MTQAEQETIDIFCRELALALRRITGKNIEIRPELLPKLEENPAIEPIGNDFEAEKVQEAQK